MRSRILDVEESERVSVLDTCRTIVRRRKVIIRGVSAVEVSPRVYNAPRLDAPTCRSLTNGEQVALIGPEATYIDAAKQVYTFAETITGGWIVIKVDGKSVVKKLQTPKSLKAVDQPLLRQVHYVSGLEGSGFSAPELVKIFVRILDCAATTLRRSTAIDFNSALRSVTRRNAVLCIALDYQMKIELNAIARSGVIADLKGLSIYHLVGSGEKSPSSSPSRITESETSLAAASKLAHAASKSLAVCEAALNVCSHDVSAALALLNSASDADLKDLVRSQSSSSPQAFDTIVVLKPKDGKTASRPLHKQPSESQVMAERSISGSISIHAKRISGEWAQLSSHHDDEDLWVRIRVGPMLHLEFDSSPKTTQWIVRIVQPDALPDDIFRNVATPYLEVMIKLCARFVSVSFSFPGT